MTNISITAISDNVCCFCYIGLLRLNRALEIYRKTVPDASLDTITTTWHAHQLDPNAPVGVSEPLLAKMALRVGAANVPSAQARLAQIGLKDGLVFEFGSRIGNTRDSHRLIQLGYAKGPEAGCRVVEEIMRMYFEGGGDITAHRDLVHAAARAGIEEREAWEWLESGKGGEEVDREVEEAKRMGVVGVPRFVINGKFVVDGAEDVNSFLEQLTLAKKAADGEV